MKKNFIILISLTLLASCTELLNVISNAENVAGLKSSLSVGIEKAVGLLGKEDGFFKDAVLKLLLPDEAKSIVEYAHLIPGGQDLVDKAVLSLNRAAEDAVNEATPIFKTAITSLTISDASNILFGADNAATEYLRKTTYTALQNAFAPKVGNSLDKELVAGYSTNQAWNSLTSEYNKVAETIPGQIAGLKPVEVDLEDYVTQKALNALFVKVADEEKAIRTDPAARVNDILKKVFGQLDEK